MLLYQWSDLCGLEFGWEIAALECNVGEIRDDDREPVTASLQQRRRHDVQRRRF